MGKRGLILLLLAAAIAALWITSGCSRHDESLDEVMQRGTIRVGLDAAFPPFEAIAPDGSIQGLDVDLARMLAQQLGVSVEFRNIAFDGLYDALAARQVDIVASALPYDPLRTREVTFSPPYFEDGIVIIGPAGKTPPSNEDLRGRLGVEMGSEAAVLARQTAREVVIVEFLSEAEVMKAVAEASVDWGLVTRVSACTHKREGQALTIGPQLTHVPYCIALRARDRALAETTVAALEAVTQSRAWRAAVARWLGEGC